MGWARAPFDDHGWAPVAFVDPPPATLVATLSPPVRRVRELRPVGIRRPPSGEMLFDLGQNFTGWARLNVSGSPGTTVTMRFGEVLDKGGNLYTANLRAAAQTDRYTLSGKSREVYEPHFTFHGFRYVAVAGLPSQPDSTTITGIAVSSDLTQTGSLITSDSLLNQLQRNIVWGQRSNFLDVPTDCPQRDERLGWTGDAQVFARTAAFNHDVAGFFTKWLQDLEDAQSPEGAFPPVAPLPRDMHHADGGPAWADAGTVVPWTLYEAYGDKRFLEKPYASMVRYVDYLEASSQDLIRTYPGYKGWMGFGDWLSIRAETPLDLIGTAFFAHSAGLLARAARVL